MEQLPAVLYTESCHSGKGGAEFCLSFSQEASERRYCEA